MELNLNDTNFESEVLNKNSVALVDFWAVWCGPCQMMVPVIKELASETEGKFTVAKVNVDESPVTASNFGIMSIPTFIVFKDGKEVSRISGARSKQALKDEVEKHL